MSIGLLFLTLVPSSRASAQYRFDHWTTDDGLPQNTIRALVQTRDGYLWFTTFDGLVRFDGVRFTVFDRNNTPGLSSNRFTALYQDKDGTLCAGTEDGSLTVYRDGLFTTLTSVEGQPTRTVMLDPMGELITCTTSDCFYLRDGKFTPVPTEHQSQQAEYYLGPSGALWKAGPTGIEERRYGRVIHYSFKIVFEAIEADVKLYEDSGGNLWVGHLAGLYRLKDGAITRYGEKDGLPPRGLLRPYSEDDDGGIWFITGRVRDPENGVARFKDGRFTFFGEASGLSKADVGHIIKDREGTIWIGTSKGLYRARKQMITAYSTAQGLAGKEVYPLLETRNGDILIGTTQWLSRFRDGRFTTLPAPKYKFVQALWEDQTSRLWIGISGGLFWYEDGKPKSAFEIVNAPNTVWAFRSDRQGNIWIGTVKGLFKFDGERTVARYTTADGLPSDDVKVIHEDRNGALWIGTYGGLARLDEGKFTAWTTRDGLASDRVRSIYEDADGTLWIGTYDGGLSRFREGRFFNYSIDNGLFNNGVFAILEDKRNDFWISCNKGIYRVGRRMLNDFADGKIQQINCVAYGKSDGMLNTECNGGRQPAGLIAADGKLWFPTQDGVAVVDPNAVTVNPLAPPVVIETIEIDRNAVAFGDSVQVKPSQTSLDITYTALSLVKSDLIRFKYKLEGLDRDWVDAGARRTAYYSYLPPGEYTFRVIAANSDGVWNDEGKSIRVIIVPPFYRTRWFIVLAIVATFGLMFFIYRYRVSRLEREQAAQHAFSRQLIASQEDERKRIAGELHDSLGQTLLIIKNRAYLGARAAGNAAPESASEQFNEISGSAAAAIDQVREISYYLRPSQLERLGLTAAIEEMLEQVAQSSGIRFDSRIKRLDGVFSPESEITFFRIVQECANNIVKHSGATRAEAIINHDEHGVDLTVGDNGTGFDPNAAQTRRITKSGFGLTGIAERVRILGGKLAIESAPGSGTIIKVRIEVRDNAK